jgi:hypothetical protein
MYKSALKHELVNGKLVWSRAPAEETRNREMPCPKLQSAYDKAKKVKADIDAEKEKEDGGE